MIELPWSVLLTLVFTATAGYCAWHWFSDGPRASVASRVVHANHAVMGVLMVVMVWWPAGQVGLWFQAAIFAVFTVLQALLALRAPGARSGVDHGVHVVLNVAMLWMLLAMPLLMSHGNHGHGHGEHAGHAGHGGHAGHTGHAGAVDPMAAMATPAWVDPVNLVVVALCVVAALWWLLPRGRRHLPHQLCHLLEAGGMAMMLVVM